MEIKDQISRMQHHVDCFGNGAADFVELRATIIDKNDLEGEISELAL